MYITLYILLFFFTHVLSTQYFYIELHLERASWQYYSNCKKVTTHLLRAQQSWTQPPVIFFKISTEFKTSDNSANSKSRTTRKQVLLSVLLFRIMGYTLKMNNQSFIFFFIILNTGTNKVMFKVTNDHSVDREPTKQHHN